MGVPRVKTGKAKQVGDAQVHTKGGRGPAMGQRGPRHAEEMKATRAPEQVTGPRCREQACPT